jgi:tetratricopeptide (TPR) repeat protein
MVATLAAARGSLRGFEGLIGWCATLERPRNLDAAYLAELLTAAFPDEPRHWNNLGLFLRDEGELLEITAHREKATPPDPALLADLYERSFAAYERALALTPDDPQVLNDTALMLQYHLGRDPEQVAAMYRRSIELSELRLAAPDLSPDDRARFEQTRSDATGNLRMLLAPPPAHEGAAPGATAGS